MSFFIHIGDFTSHDDCYFADVSDKTPLWTCRNAMKPEHSCTYAICQSCFVKINVTSRNQKKRQRHAIDDSSRCNHTDLTAFVDSKYFRKEYIKKCIAAGSSMPTKCTTCAKILTNSKQMRVEAV